MGHGGGVGWVAAFRSQAGVAVGESTGFAFGN